MSRIRTVKPELFKHETLFDAERATKLPLRLAFIGLLTCCDREGRFKWRPGRLKLDLLPYDNINVSEILDAFVVYGFVDKYEYQGNWYGCIPSWSKHQYVNHREMASEIPEPNTASQIINYKNATKTSLAAEQNVTSLVENLQSYQNKATEKNYLDNIVNFVTPAAVETSQSYHNNIGQDATINLVVNGEVKQTTISQNLVEHAPQFFPGNAHLCPGTPGGNMERNMEGNMERNMIVDKSAALRVSNKITLIEILPDLAKKQLEPTSKNNLLTSKIINVENQEADHFQLVKNNNLMIKTNNKQDINLVNQQQLIKQDSRLNESFRAHDQKLQDSDNKILHRDPVDSARNHLANNLIKHFVNQTADGAGSKQKISKTKFGELLDLLKKPQQYQQFLKIDDSVKSLTDLDQYFASNASNYKLFNQNIKNANLNCSNVGCKLASEVNTLEILGDGVINNNYDQFKMLDSDPVDSVSKNAANNLSAGDSLDPKKRLSKAQFGALLDLVKNSQQYQQFLKIDDTVGSLTDLDQYFALTAINCKPLNQTNSDEKKQVTEQSQIATENTNLSEESSDDNGNQAYLLQDPEKFLQSSTSCLELLLNITENNLSETRDSKASYDLS